MENKKKARNMLIILDNPKQYYFDRTISSTKNEIKKFYEDKYGDRLFTLFEFNPSIFSIIKLIFYKIHGN